MSNPEARILELELAIKRALEYNLYQVMRRADVFKLNEVLYGREVAIEKLLGRGGELYTEEGVYSD